jgi:hypothetical protein
MAQNARKLTVAREGGFENERLETAGVPAPMRGIQQAIRLLQVALVLFFVGAGLDKYLHVLTNWEQYVSPLMMNALGTQGTHTLMAIEAPIEIVLGIGVALRPRIFAYIVGVWLIGIALNLLTTGHFYDIVLRDVALSLCAFALGRLATARAKMANPARI